MRYRLGLIIEALRDLYFLATIPLLRLLRALIVPLAALMGGRRRAEYALINLSNLLVSPLTRHLGRSRDAMESLDRFWDTYDRNGLEIYAEIMGDSKWFAGKRVLDFGCGVGRKAYELAANGAAEVVGIDLAERCIGVAQAKAGQNGCLSYLAVDLADLPDRGYRSAFDHVVSFTVFEHLSDPKSILAGLSELLAPGGRILIVFNYYHDKWGMHLGSFVSHPWPQAIFSEQILFEYWTDRLKDAHRRGGMGYFPADYRHGADGHNNDCFLNLNRWTVDDFERCVAASGWTIARRSMYSRSPLARLLGTRDGSALGKWLAGSGAYLLERAGGKA